MSKWVSWARYGVAKARSSLHLYDRVSERAFAPGPSWTAACLRAQPGIVVLSALRGHPVASYKARVRPAAAPVPVACAWQGVQVLESGSSREEAYKLALNDLRFGRLCFVHSEPKDDAAASFRGPREGGGDAAAGPRHGDPGGPLAFQDFPRRHLVRRILAPGPKSVSGCRRVVALQLSPVSPLLLLRALAAVEGPRALHK